MRYLIVYGKQAEKVQELVTDLLNEGWRPAGGIALSYEVGPHGDVVNVFGQALVHDGMPDAPSA